MLLKLFSLLALTALWFGILWLALPFDFLRFSLAAIIALHMLPPLFMWTLWHASFLWLKQQRRTRAQVSERHRLTELENRKNVYLQQFDSDLKLRRTAIQCRWIKAADVICHDAFAPIPGIVETSDAEALTLDLSWPAQTLVSMLEELFSQLPVAAMFPIALRSMPGEQTDQVLKLIEQVRKASLQRHEIASNHSIVAPIRLWPPNSGHLAAQISNLLSLEPDLPGLTLIAFDSPWQPEPDAGLWDIGHTVSDRDANEPWLGKASRACVCAVFTPAVLDDVLAIMRELPGTAPLDEMAPYWERRNIPAGMANYLSRAPKAFLTTLAANPVLANWHRTETISLIPKEPMSQRIAGVLATIRSAAENAGLLNPPREFEGELIADGKLPDVGINDCCWLVHNAGSMAVCGERLAMLASAMMQISIDLNPVGEATNSAIVVGNSGVASQLVQLAFAIGRVTEFSRPALLAEFDSTTLSTSFLMPLGGT